MSSTVGKWRTFYGMFQSPRTKNVDGKRCRKDRAELGQTKRPPALTQRLCLRSCLVNKRLEIREPKLVCRKVGLIGGQTNEGTGYSTHHCPVRFFTRKDSVGNINGGEVKGQRLAERSSERHRHGCHPCCPLGPQDLLCHRWAFVILLLRDVLTRPGREGDPDDTSSSSSIPATIWDVRLCHPPMPP